MCDRAEHFNSPERINKWGGESLGTAVALTVALGLGGHFLKAAHPEEVKAMKAAVSETAHQVVDKIAAIEIDECTMKALAHSPPFGCNK